jgi:hypothetical protein
MALCADRMHLKSPIAWKRAKQGNPAWNDRELPENNRQNPVDNAGKSLMARHNWFSPARPCQFAGEIAVNRGLFSPLLCGNFSPILGAAAVIGWFWNN